MSVTIIASAPGLNLPGPAAVGMAADAGASGSFAALLGGELLTPINLAAELSGLITIGNPDTPVSTAADDKNEATAADDADTALLASLFGQLAGAEIAPKDIQTPITPVAVDQGGKASLPLDAASLPLDTSGKVNSPIDTNNKASLPLDAASKAKATPELLAADAKSAPQKAAGLFDKLPGNDGAVTVRAQAANIAGANATTETPGLAASQLTANGAAAAVSQAASQTVNAAPLRVDAPIHTPVWPQQFGDQVVWLAKNDRQIAQLDINPPQLGPVQITVNLNGNQASILFASPHAEVRQAIENAMPQLKEMLSAAGINLGQADVGANPQQPPPSEMAFGDANGTRASNETAILPANAQGADTDRVAGTAVLQRGRGLVDLFA
ncbi:MAG: flagellar hook-length control protein FliK [Azonexus sp.]|jgi:flagellar hook-length control protein FliK|nr:flagellar hook-length control protein FliK [Azonexus sp.]